MEDATTGALPEISSLHMTNPIMRWKYARRKSIVLLTLAAGVVVAAILFFVQRFPIRLSLSGCR
jgi:hypothetical protein